MAKKQKSAMKECRNIIRIAFATAIAVFVVLVLFNAFRPYATATVDESILSDNLKIVAESQTADVTDVEKQVNKLNAASRRNNAENMISTYRKMFGTSVILGDSLTEGLTVYGWLTDATVFSKIGGSILYSDDIFAKAASIKPEFAFFAYGMNDMGNFNGNTHNYIKKYTKMLQKFKKKSPKTVIVVNSISTPTKEARKGNKSIRAYKKFNSAIKKMCKENNYLYIDIEDILPDNPDLYAGDGIHAAPDYYPIWMDRMVQTAGLIKYIK